jgi:peptide/nickel transport system permease protein
MDNAELKKQGVDNEKEKIAVATPRQLMWWKFRKHRMAVISGVVLCIFYLAALFADFISPYDPTTMHVYHQNVPPMYVSFTNDDGHFTLRPGVHHRIMHKDPETLAYSYEVDESTWYPIRFLVHERPYRLLGLFKTDIHLFGLGQAANDPQSKTGGYGKNATLLLILGTDDLGRDLFSRILYGARISLSIGLVAVLLSLTLGIVLGGISGYYGGLIDNVIQRVIEFMRSIPTLPLWMALGAALPPDWSQQLRYFAITIILSMVGWTWLARQVRGRFLAMRTEDFVLAARLSGAKDRRIILRHMVPSFTSHIIAMLTLAIPDIILAETGLSFLGLGLREPVISWGVLLEDARALRVVANSPWMLLPGLAVVITVLAFSFLGDGLRDAADPFNR